MIKEAKTELIQLIKRFDFDLVLHITPRRIETVEILQKDIKYFFKHLNAPGDKFYDKYVTLWCFFERFDKCGVHSHILLKGIPPDKAKELAKRCNTFFGDTMVALYKTKENIAAYTLKNYGKDELEHYDYYKINARYRGN